MCLNILLRSPQTKIFLSLWALAAIADNVINDDWDTLVDRHVFWAFFFVLFAVCMTYSITGKILSPLTRVRRIGSAPGCRQSSERTDRILSSWEQACVLGQSAHVTATRVFLRDASN